MDNYVLLLHEGPAARNGVSPEAMQATIARYKAWREKLAVAGRMTGAHKLEDGTARMMTGAAPSTRITDGPYTETKDVVGGFFIIQANDYQEAVELTRDCPHLDFGTIEVRKVHVV